MVALKINKGKCFEIYAIEENGMCEVLDFMNLMHKTDFSTMLKLVADFDRTADTGLIVNIERFGALGGNLYEFRVTGKGRVLCFLDGTTILVLTNGFTSYQPDDGTAHAVDLRTRYFVAKRNGYLTYREDFYD